MYDSKLVKLWQKCPLRGCRASSMGAGDFAAFLFKCFSDSAAQLLFELQGNPEHTIKFAISEFEGARVYIIFHLTLKSASDTVNPVRAMGLAHDDPNKAHQTWAFVKQDLAKGKVHPRLEDLREGELFNQIEEWALE